MKILKNKFVSNAMWLMSEKILNIFGLIFITSAVAKYIGPDDFGKINLALYVFSIFQVVAIWGSDTIGLKLISKYPSRGVAFLRSFFFFKILVFLFISIIISFYFYFYKDNLTFLFSLSVCVSSFFYVIDYYYIYNEAKLLSFINVITNVIGLLGALVIRFIITHDEINPVYLTIPIILQGMIPSVLRFIIFKYKFSHQLKLNRFQKRYLKFGVFSGFGLFFSTISIMIYINVGRLMLAEFSGLADVGIYSVAITLGTTWIFLSNAIIVSLTPKIYSSSLNERFSIIALLSQVLILIGVFYFVFFYLLGGYVIHWFYGGEYNSAFSASLILIISTTISSLGIVAARFIVSEGGYGFEAKKALITALVSIVLNFLLVRSYGMYGVAWASLFSELLSLTILNYMYKNKIVLKLHVNSLSIKKSIDGFHLIAK